MTTIAVQNWVRNLGAIGSVAIYLACLLLSAVFWLTQGTVLGSIAGGMCFGFLMSPKQFLGYKSQVIESILSPVGFIAFIGLYFWKEHSLMPPDWEPARYYDAVAMVGVLIAFGLSFAFGMARDPSLGKESEADAPEAPTVNSSKESASEDEHIPLTKMERAATAFAVLNLLSCLVLNLAVLRPDWISTSDIALSRYIVKSVYDYKSKDHLAYVLAGMTEVSVQSKSFDGNTVTADLNVLTPVVPFSLSPDQANSMTALRKYNELPSDQKPYATLTGKVVLEKSGLGWIVVQETVDTNPVTLSREFRAGNLQVTKLDHPTFPINMFGLDDFASQPFNPILIMAVGIMLLMLLAGKRPFSVAVASIFILAMSYMPIALTFSL